MKKSVVITIGVIYGLSIVFVTLFGLKHQSFNEIVYVSQVTIVEDNASYYPSGAKYIMLTEGENGTAQYQIVWRVSPDDATNSAVTFDYDKENTCATVDENGLVTFTKQGAIAVTVTATDGTSQSDTIQIIWYQKNK